MADAPTFRDLFRIFRDEALARNALLSLEIIERDGTDANLLAAGAAAAGDEVITQLVRLEESLFLDSASGAALDRLVFDRYGLTRKPAAAAVGSVSFTTTAANPSAFTIPGGTLLQTTAGVQYVTTASVLFPATSTGPISASVRSVLAGIDQQAKAGTINSIVSQIVGSPTDLVVTNPLATAGADDEETDDSLRARARLFFTTARRGTKSAIEQGALAVPGVRTATAIEVLDTFGRPARVVQLVVADAFTEQLALFSDAPPPAYQAQAQTLATTVANGLEDVRAHGVQVQVLVAAVVLQPIVLRLTFNAGADVASATLQARAAAVNYTNELAPGQTWEPVGVVNRLRPISGLFISGAEVASPAGPVIPNPLQVIRTGLELVTTSSA